MTKCKVADHPSLSNKVVFKFMDLEPIPIPPALRHCRRVGASQSQLQPSIHQLTNAMIMNINVVMVSTALQAAFD